MLVMDERSSFDMPLSKRNVFDTGQFQLPFVTPDVENNNPLLAAEFDLVKDNLRDLTQQIALKDRIHQLRVNPFNLRKSVQNVGMLR